MLRACKASRKIIVKRLPIRLQSFAMDEEIRIGRQDILGFSTFRFLRDFSDAIQHELDIPSAIKQIRNIGFLVDGTSRGSFGDFMLTTFGRNSRSSPRDCFAGFENLEKIMILCADGGVQQTKSLHGFTTHSETQPLSHDQRITNGFAVTGRRLLISAMNAWKAHEKNSSLKNLPEVMIMAKGWPTKQGQSMIESTSGI